MNEPKCNPNDHSFNYINLTPARFVGEKEPTSDHRLFCAKCGEVRKIE